MLTQNEKAFMYDECLRESDALQRANSKFKSDYVGNIPPHIQDQINKNTARIQVLVVKLESLFN